MPSPIDLTFLNLSVLLCAGSYNVDKAKTDIETNVVVTAGFTTEVDHQTTSKIDSMCAHIDL